MASHSGNRSDRRPPDMQVSSHHDSRGPNAQPAVPVPSATASGLPMAKNQVLLAEAVDSVVNTFAKHARGYGRGELLNTLPIMISTAYSKTLPPDNKLTLEEAS